jgi:2-amino-4-hydroxy-6-hydroxymethyldihydropteridine diphosphokinase
MTTVGLSLGSNVGDKIAVLSRALDRLDRRGLAITAASSFYRTEPWGHLEQEWFVNLCAVGETDLEPVALLALVKAVEGELGRRATFRWGPREIDIDLLFVGDVALATPELILPHAALFERGFVLVPLAEIAPDAVVAGRRIAEAAVRFRAEAITRIAPPWTRRP